MCRWILRGLKACHKESNRIDPFGSSATLIAGGHLLLDGLGMIPGVGMVFDGINCIWYAAKGDWVNAGLSAVSIVPGVGDIAGGVRLGAKVTVAAIGATGVGARAVGAIGGAAGAGKVASNAPGLNQMNKMIQTGQAPKTIVRVDKPGPGSGDLNHIHFTDGAVLRQDGTVSHKGKGDHVLTNKELEWLQSNGYMMGR